MAVDQLSALLEVIEARNVVSGGFAVKGRWLTRYEFSKQLKLIAVVHGRARLTADGLDGWIDLEAGDVAILSDRRWEALEGGVGDGPRLEFVVDEADPYRAIDGATWSDADVIIGGNVDVNQAGQALLSAALPAIGHVRSASSAAPRLRDILNQLLDEVTGNRLGAGFAIQHLGQLLLVEALRAYVAQAPELTVGWLRAMSDERLAPALHCIHTEPGKPWGLEELARAAAMSRTAFAERFRAVAGVPPLTYLSGWRMQLARQALRDSDVRVGTLAGELGYASESAFSNAFKREVGVSPLRYRAQVSSSATRL